MLIDYKLNTSLLLMLCRTVCSTTGYRYCGYQQEDYRRYLTGTQNDNDDPSSGDETPLLCRPT